MSKVITYATVISVPSITMWDQFDYWKFLAGLGIFLFGMSQIEVALRTLAGRSFRVFLRNNTNTRIKAILAGIVITALLQSSSVVSLMTLAMVGAGIMTMTSALGIIIGSNLGTTLKGWIVAIFGFKFSIESFSLPMLAIGGITYLLLGKYEKPSNIGRLLIGFGFMFLGLDFMKTSIDFLAQTFDLSPYANYGPVVFLLVGFIFTAIIQSSSATMVITLSALNSGIITFPAATAMVIGADLGTTITALIGGMPGIPIKKRVALGHFLFNLVTDIIAFIFMVPITNFITKVLGIADPLMAVVAFHSSFNLIGILIFAPTLSYFARFLENRFKKSTPFMGRFIHQISSFELSEEAIQALKNETGGLLEDVIQLNRLAFKQVHSSFWQGRDAFSKQYLQVKQLESEIFAFYNSLQQEKLQPEESVRLNQIMLVVRYALHSAKSLKDIEPNLRDFENAGIDSLMNLYQAFKSNSGQFIEHAVIFFSATAHDMEMLIKLSAEIQKNYDDIPLLISEKKFQKEVPPLDISTALTVNREMYSTHRSLILALNHFIMPNELAREFANMGIIGK
ncbi:Na/Pi cotransporter family protein [Fulvivirga sedimenti]|uniref:Na/Pi symporter n=1 Tax=Fulvivirga sedimenti TaxID=2879465 RepID=A0A9X1HU33_9BACT|nr:Na/Pi symporter [Fulvivirga sedimenti]MCA6074537.1 Na/Pi symporter [Fulvivirga sedimenti]MCA6075714.1 Na/Pi symporter [Fulvivirga sedimenti]MCA6076842.1 Na/Pi symporter [Fulvivirga sedimenti]